MKGSAAAGTATWAVRRPSLLKRFLVWADRRIKARENWQGSDPDWLRPVIVMGPIISLRGAYRVLAGPAALTSSCVLPFLPFLFWQIRLEHSRRLFREEREKLADPDSRRAKAEVEALLKRDAP